VRALAAALLLCACSTNGAGRYLLVTDTYHGPIVWSKFKSLEACASAQRGSDPRAQVRCTTRAELRR
jgi:hypothetical protein